MTPTIGLRAAVAVLCVMTTWCASAAVLTVNVSTEITSMNLTGSAVLPLARDPNNDLGDSVEGYGGVNTNMQVSESVSLTSTGMTSLIIDTTDLLNITVALQSRFDFFLDITLTDNDPAPGRDFAPGLSNPIVLMAQSGDPLTVELSSDLAFGTLDPSGVTVDDFGTLISSSTLVHNLVDVNGNNMMDVIKLEATGFDFDPNDLTFGDISFDQADLLSVLLGTDVTINAQGSLSITSASMTFDGAVEDAAVDPPFTISLFGDVNGATSVDEPSPAILLILGLLLLVGTLSRTCRGTAASIRHSRGRASIRSGISP